MNEKEVKTAKRVYDLYSNCEQNPYFSAFAAACRENEDFYLGHQWKPGEGAELIRPVFNIIQRVCDYRISTLCNKDYSLSYSLDGAPPSVCSDKKLLNAVDALNKHIRYVADKEMLERLLFSAVRDAVVYGSGVFYTYWDPQAETGHHFRGTFKTTVLDPAVLFPSDPKDCSVESQEYFIIKGRAAPDELVREAHKHHGNAESIKAISADDEEDGKCEFLILLEKYCGKVRYTKVACGVLISAADTGLSHYPISVFTPTPKRGSFFGESLVSGMIPNQRYINRSYCMLMKHMQDTAFSKVIYDKSRIPEWTGEAGVAIGAHGGGNLADSVAVVGCGELSDGYTDFTERIMTATRELYGATDVALGNVEPNNTSAILAAREAAAGQLRGSIICLSSALEAQARIWADMVITCYGKGRYVPIGNREGISGADFNRITQSLLRCRIDVSDLSKFGTSVTLTVLDKLLDCGAISPEQYLSRLPDGLIPEKESLLSEIKERNENQNGINNRSN